MPASYRVAARLARRTYNQRPGGSGRRKDLPPLRRAPENPSTTYSRDMRHWLVGEGLGGGKPSHKKPRDDTSPCSDPRASPTTYYFLACKHASAAGCDGMLKMNRDSNSVRTTTGAADIATHVDLLRPSTRRGRRLQIGAEHAGHGRQRRVLCPHAGAWKLGMRIEAELDAHLWPRVASRCAAHASTAAMRSAVATATVSWFSPKANPTSDSNGETIKKYPLPTP